MRQAVSGRRFRAVITREGTIVVPAAARKGLKTGQPVWVEIGTTTSSALHRALKALKALKARQALVERNGSGKSGAPDDPDDQEVAAIAALQAENPDVIRRCLRAQGALVLRADAGRPLGSR